MDPGLKPYAAFLEDFLEMLIKHRPKKIATVALLDGGRNISGYFGAVYPVEKTMMGHRLQMDGLLDEVFAHAAEIVKEAEAQQEEEEDT